MYKYRSKPIQNAPDTMATGAKVRIAPTEYTRPDPSRRKIRNPRPSSATASPIQSDADQGPNKTQESDCMASARKLSSAAVPFPTSFGTDDQMSGSANTFSDAPS